MYTDRLTICFHFSLNPLPLFMAEQQVMLIIFLPNGRQ